MNDMRQSGAIVPIPSNTPALSFTEMMQAAKFVVDSKLFAGVQTEAQAMTLMMLCRSEGLDPIQAMRRYHIIQNRPTMRADAMQAEFQARGGKIQWHQRDDIAAEATFDHPSGGELRIRWDMERAQKAGLVQKNGSLYGSYARQMLHARCVSEGVRAILPAVVMGIYTPEEIRDSRGRDATTDESEIMEGEMVEQTSPAASAPASPAPTSRPQKNELPRCSVEGCANVLTSGQMSMSQQKFGRAICLMHQRDPAITNPTNKNTALPPSGNPLETASQAFYEDAWNLGLLPDKTAKKDIQLLFTDVCRAELLDGDATNPATWEAAKGKLRAFRTRHPERVIDVNDEGDN